jgi:NADH:ubiquinone oxidoreductase subunit 6 (subunit J)
LPILFYISSFIAIVSTIMVITRYHPVHALLYLVVSFLAIAMIFLSLGAPFVAVLEIILYAGAIVVLVIFVVMMLNLGTDTASQEKQMAGNRKHGRPFHTLQLCCLLNWWLYWLKAHQRRYAGACD